MTKLQAPIGNPRVWLITGCSGGFGRAVAEAALARGDRVIGTLRQPAQCGRFEELAPGRASSST
jgi:NAD(P)-dependent dehydrogenase (short-subunit alcohol dehydrogenase family)